VQVNFGRVKAIMVVLSLLAASSFMVAGSVSPAYAEDDASLQCAKEEAKTVVHATAFGLAELLKGVKGTKEGIELIRSFISPIRFYGDNSGYFYVYDYDCVNIAHTVQKDLQGRNLKDHKDSKGKFVIRELSAAAKQGGGFVEYYWPKAGAKGESRKIGYVEPIPGTAYFIGTGVYVP